MTRPLRRIDDHVDVTLHQPDRPSWLCPTCATPWPCRALRDHLLATLDPGRIALYMGAFLQMAERELAGEVAPMTVYDRLLGWVGAAPRQHPLLRRPPGGPW
jgi:hypothetical protein